MEKKEPSIPLDELKRRYEALGPLEEDIGGRSYKGRCYNFSQFLLYGPVIAKDIAQGLMYDDGTDLYRNFATLVTEAWPQQS